MAEQLALFPELEASAPSAPLAQRERLLTNDLKETLAGQLVNGLTSTELAELHGVEVQKMRKWLASEGVQERATEKRERVIAKAAQAHMRFLMVADQLAKDQVQEALDPSSPNQYKARTYILDRVLPQRTTSTGEHSINIQINNGVIRDLAAAVEGASRARLGSVSGAPSLIAGKDALPPIGAQVE